MNRIACLVTAGLAVVLPLYAQQSSQLSLRAAARLLDQATWGPTSASIAQLQQMGTTAWLNAQFTAPISNLPNQPQLTSTGARNYNMHPLEAAFYQNALNGTDQLRQRVAFALSEMWVVSAVGVPDAYAYPYYYQLLSQNAFGNYRNIINAITLSPAMGRYLNVANNNKANSKGTIVPNENYAREMQQLFTIGLTELNQDGTPILDSSGNPIPTYDQTEITNTARVLTGWTYPTAPGATPVNNNPIYYIGQMYPVASEHDTGSKTTIGGIVIPAGQTAQQDLNSLINALMAQPTMAPFVCTQLIQHLVTSNPSPQYVSRVAAVFQNDGTGVQGNMQAVITAILTDPEARAGDDPNNPPNANFGHMREPALFMANMIRGLPATLNANSLVYNPVNNMGQNLFSPASVFSYFSPQFRTTSGLLGPEFQLYTTAAASVRANTVNAILYGKIDYAGTTFDISAFEQFGNNYSALAEYISQMFFYDSMSSNLTNAVISAASATTSTKSAAQAALYIALTSAEYQIVH